MGRFLSCTGRARMFGFTGARAAVSAMMLLTLLAVAPPPAAAQAEAQVETPEPRVCDGCSPPLVNYGGPVMATAGVKGEITITPIYWTPAGFSFADSYTGLINRYIADVAAASGATDNVYSVDTEYSGITYLIHAGTPASDTKAFPTNACVPDPGFSICLSAAQVEAEVAAVVAANALPADLGHLYPLFLPPQVETNSIETKNGVAKETRSKSDFCAYHTAGSGEANLIFSVEPYADNCLFGQSPNRGAAQDKVADAAVDTLAHEIMESITDPTSPAAWKDTIKANENADMCSSNHGPPLGSTDPADPQTTRYNQVINGGKYYTQTNFSNARFNTVGAFTGCVQGEAQALAPAPVPAPPGAPAPTADPTGTPAAGGMRAVSPLSPGAGLNTVIVDATTYDLPADGAATSTLTATVVDSGGVPVAGDDVHFHSGTTRGTAGSCGTLDRQDGRTDAKGVVTVRYTASTADVACDVIAGEGATGQSDQAEINQGAAVQTAPRITATFPPSLTPGAPPAGFTAVVRNPSSVAIPHARIDLVITDDNSSAQGIDAGQLHLSFADAATNGQFVDIPLTGSTAADDEIEGDLPPEVGATFPAQATATVTFRVSLDAGVPATAVTGTRLHFELFLSQVNPADGATTTLDSVEGVVAVQAAGNASSPLCSQLQAQLARTSDPAARAQLAAALAACQLATTTATTTTTRPPSATTTTAVPPTTVTSTTSVPTSTTTTTTVGTPPGGQLCQALLAQRATAPAFARGFFDRILTANGCR